MNALPRYVDDKIEYKGQPFGASQEDTYHSLADRLIGRYNAIDEGRDTDTGYQSTTIRGLLQP